MDLPLNAIRDLTSAIGFALISALVSFAWAPFLINFLYKHKIIRQSKYDPTLSIESRKDKANVPVMGGLLIIVTVAVLTVLFNWSRTYTWVPIGVMLLSAALGGVDDLLNIFGTKRRFRSVAQTVTLAKVHKSGWVRFYLWLTIPWVAFRRAVSVLGSNPGTGVHVHEKLLLQFAAGGMTAWWIFWKLGERWQSIDIPFAGAVDISWLIVPLIIFLVVFTANAVNIADGMDGLAGGMLIPTFAALSALSWFSGSRELALLNATIVGSLIAYTYFNIKPARFQMGDVGSLGLGALLAINAIAINQFIPLLLLGFMFYVEACTVLIQLAGRVILGRRVFKMAPIHHHFELKGWSEEKTIMRFWIVHLVFVILGVWLALH
ncbi:MAG: phospho-N-acetylmuramoyl-pentapeptide-transferase [Candidatus Taylorbacteria bacterium]|nr:phospho-N-acetylmuramoyl-pentapeptide-transferase [Candidatus Taylorbacteria bacterium]